MLNIKSNNIRQINRNNTLRKNKFKIKLPNFKSNNSYKKSKMIQKINLS